MTSNYLTAKATAAEIRLWLKARNIKPVRCRISRGAWCSTVYVTLRAQDYTLELAGEIEQTFKAGTFDGMTDSFDYRTDAHYKCADGVTRRLSCRYVFVERQHT